MAIYVLEREQTLPFDAPYVFSFFADAGNLDAITPPWLHFQILTPLPMAMQQGALLEYRIRWRWLPVRWTTVIEEWNPPHGFVDRQLTGPYQLWQHAHRFEAVPGGTNMIDVVRYAIPYGPLGALAHAGVVRRDLQHIFDYRRDRVEALLKARA